MVMRYLRATFSNGFVMTRQSGNVYTHAWFYDFESAMQKNKDGTPKELRIKGFSSSLDAAHRKTRVRGLKIVRREVVPVEFISRAVFEDIRDLGHTRDDF